MQRLIVICLLLATVNVTQSRRWYASEVNCWITQEKVPALWEDAQQRCERHGAILASPLNAKLFDYMQSLINMNNHSAGYFIGIRANRSDDGQEVRYVSIEGKQLDDMPRDVFNAIELLDLEQGDCLSMSRHGIRAVSCFDHLPYICYSNETTECGIAPTGTSLPPTSSTAPPQQSQAGYTYVPETGNMYKFHKDEAPWDDAESTCQREGGHLVVVNDAVEANAVANIVNNAGYKYTWVGLRDRRPGGEIEWRAISGEPLSTVYSRWDIGRPFKTGDWTCGIMYDDKLLYDASCNIASFYTCEISQL